MQVLRITPKRLMRINGLALSPEMVVTVTTKSPTHVRFRRYCRLPLSVARIEGRLLDGLQASCI